MRLFTPFLALFLVSACVSTEGTTQSGPLFFEVEFTGTPDGLDPAAPGPFSTEAVSYGLRITAIGAD